MSKYLEEMLERAYERFKKLLDIVFIILDIVKKIKATYELLVIAKVALTHLISFIS